MRDELLALLEDGPKETGQLVEWLAQPAAAIRKALRGLKRDGFIKTVGTAKRWALISHVSQGGPTRRAQISPSTVLRDRRRHQAEPQAPAPAMHEPELLEADDVVDADADAELADQVLERRPLRQPKATTKVNIGKDTTRSWWLDKSPAEFASAAAARDKEMQTSPQWRRQVTKGLGVNE